MKSWLKHPLRVSVRLAWLGVELLLSAFRYAIDCAFLPQDSLAAARARWLQNTSRRLLRVLRIEIQCSGDIPSSGLLVCNHLSYLDILVLSAFTPCVFVAKREVKHWPVFGRFARMAGTVFVHREQRTQVAQAVDQIGAALRPGAVVVIFPEGTSSGGETVYPFRSSLLEPAARQPHSLTAGLLRYELDDGNVSEEICYWKDMTLVPHLVNLCSKRAIQASVQFSLLREGNADRKQLARQLHAEVLRMKQASAYEGVALNRLRSSII